LIVDHGRHASPWHLSRERSQNTLRFYFRDYVELLDWNGLGGTWSEESVAWTFDEGAWRAAMDVLRERSMAKPSPFVLDHASP